MIMYIYKCPYNGHIPNEFCVLVTFYISGNSFIVIVHFNTIVVSTSYDTPNDQTHIFDKIIYTG